MTSNARGHPAIPRWTSHDPEGKTKAKPPKDRGMGFYMGRSLFWCYRCRSEHPWEQPCEAAQ